MNKDQLDIIAKQLGLSTDHYYTASQKMMMCKVIGGPSVHGFAK